MLYEKKKILIHRIIWGILLFLGVIIPIIVDIVLQNSVKILDSEGYSNYYESLDETNCKIEVTFSSNVDNGDIKVAFYDSTGKLLEEQTEYLFGYGNTLTAYFFVDGEVAYYDILEFDVYVGAVLDFISLLILVDGILFAFFIGSLLLSCKIYSYNDKEILVYAGWYHHYIKVDGIKVDEHNTLVSHTAITMSSILDDGTDLKATITLTNRISLKINNRLYTNQLPLRENIDSLSVQN